MMPPLALVLLALAAAVAPGARAQISAAPLGAPARSLDCAGALRSLTPCLTYVERRSALTRPDKGCCGALAAVVGGGDAACLCGLLAGHGARGVRVDPVRALALPTICRVDAPPPRLCAALGMPVAEPPGGAAAPMESGASGIRSAPAPRAVDATPFLSMRLPSAMWLVLVGFSNRLLNNSKGIVDRKSSCQRGVIFKFAY
ncbi:non-specific lipid-transfer protein-like protein At2g13820 isoform X1 [Panicum hallii]|uniref:non-specific lipid-transfer protein-like protein At2g13820 isoform X1 n=1 Tax=Panicum hallii TaxID=206008 RepID=UPI000DF4EE14|nr:non-specific lipid-transfer protein-like protein At2g13820 isoform X1 [Panicum hallii]